uniref:Uncharacterized protein n=3 Tax=Candidatus Kentrum sp. FM TaxID=2126340 RepID=A0A450W3B0_9GAMM|nr:MAG: hypothetical protein BECKFM1743B_GA0114221_101891 [Candidatus Kentron sp. FM]
MRLCCAILLSVDFLFFLYAFHAATSIRYWFAIDIAIRYRYRSYPACSIASSDIDSDIDSDSDRTTITGCGSPRCAFCGDNASVSGDSTPLPQQKDTPARTGSVAYPNVREARLFPPYKGPPILKNVLQRKINGFRFF